MPLAFGLPLSPHVERRRAAKCRAGHHGGHAFAALIQPGREGIGKHACQWPGETSRNTGVSPDHTIALTEAM